MFWGYREVRSPARSRRIMAILAIAGVIGTAAVGCGPASTGSASGAGPSASGSLPGPTPAPARTSTGVRPPTSPSAPVFGGPPVTGATSSPAPKLTITSRDGVSLAATVVAPSGAGRYPLAVIPAAWGFDDESFLSVARELSRRGYVVVVYTTRGFYSSGGTVDVAGPLDVSDVSDVITWALAHTNTDPARIGVAGLSYGAGIALLAAAQDPRIRAVGSLSGWADFGYSLYAANTRHKAALNLLTTLQEATGRRGPEFDAILTNYKNFQDIDAVMSWAKGRGAATFLTGLNAHQPAIFMSASLGDNYFSAASQIDFFGRFTGPKTFRLTPGDHGTNEIGGVLGLPNEVWTNAWDWFDRYLNPDAAVARTPPPAPIQLITDDGAVEKYPDWAAATRGATVLQLGPAFLGTGGLTPAGSADAWSTTIHAGKDTPANAGTILISAFFQGLTRLPAALSLASIDRADGAVWQTTPGFQTQRLRGIPTMRLTMTPNAATGTVVAYLYDTDPAGRSTLISKGVHTYLNATPGEPLVADLAFDPVAHNVPPGHRISLAIDTKDDLYYDLDTSGGTVAFGSPPDTPSELRLPLG